jgi:GntR family transcriptional regulator/MocR family aminotransferase
MPKRSGSFELILPLRQSGTPANRWLYWALRNEILEARMRPGARLPGTRELAGLYGLSRGTIVSAFDQLKSEGYVHGSVGSGTYVSRILPDELLRVNPGASSPPLRPQRRMISSYGRRVAFFPVLENRLTRAFRPNMPALDLFPAATWAHTTSRRLRHAATDLFLGCDPMGYRPLRDAVADYLNTSRGVRCVADQVVIVSGVQEAIDLVARLFLNPGERVCVEDPGYPGAVLACEAVGARISPIGLDDEGMKLHASSLRGARLVYVTPAHQFPLGITMSLRRRLELLEWARKSNAFIFEDDYDGEFRYSGRPVLAMQGLDRSGHVLFSGSFSKVLFPSLRLGYLVTPPDLIPYFEAAKSITTRHPPLIEQAVLCDFMTAGHFGRHLRRMREIYAGRLSALQDAAKESLRGLLEISTVEAGLQTSGWLCAGVAAEGASKAAKAKDVEVVPLSVYSRRRSLRQGLQLGFAAIDEHEIRRGVRELATVLERAAHAPSKRNGTA